jgi:hypothetical protein
MRFYWLILGVLAVWRLTHLLQAEDGPRNLIVRLRRLAGSGFWAGLLDCFYCLSLWIAAPFAWFFGERAAERLLLWLALSAGAILLERITGTDKTTPAPYWKEEDWKEEDPDGMLRTESPGAEPERSARG